MPPSNVMNSAQLDFPAKRCARWVLGTRRVRLVCWLRVAAVALAVPALASCSRSPVEVTISGGGTTVSGVGVSPSPDSGTAPPAESTAGNLTPEHAAATVQGPGPVEPNALVDHVIDGDTIAVRFVGSARRAAPIHVRLIGIDTPETKRPGTPVECFGPEASRFLTALLPEGASVRVERDVEERDKYQRLLGYVYRADDGLFVNRAIAAGGFAQQLTYPPNIAHVDEFAAAVAQARDGELGLWRSCPVE